MEKTSTPWHARFAFTLALLLPAYFAVAALGTKFGLWTWQFGLGALIGGAGPWLLGIVGIVALISLIAVLIKAPRKGWALALIGLIIPAAAFGYLGTVRETAGANPIYDVATDTATPPTFSDATMAARAEIEANPVNDYAAPLSENEWWEGKASDDNQAKSMGQIVGELYPDLGPIQLDNTSTADALAAVEGGMEDIGLTGIVTNAEAGTVEGVAETFWFGFEDDVVARVADGKIDFRSVSRVGVSDLGANSKRIVKLRTLVASRLGQ